VGLLAILKAGGAYVPLDPAYPHERLGFMLQDANASILLTQQKYAARLPAPLVFCFDRDEAQVEGEDVANPAKLATSANLIYVIYTSGSTGRPKGAGVYHRGFANLLNWFLSEFKISERDRVLLVSSLSFDLTQKNIYAPLLCGGTLHLLPSGPYDVPRIVRTIETEKITLINCTPSAFYPLVEAGEHDFHRIQSLRCVFLGGETISISRLRPWLESKECRAEIANTYGPTECSDICAFYRMNRDRIDAFSFVPVGRPIFNTQLFILDGSLQPCPPGMAGELCVAGRGVGAGYLNDSVLTAAKFVPNPVSGKPGDVLYKTGDFARTLPDGNIEYLGRMDHQVKLRGFRIELREIENALAEHSAVREAVVVVRGEAPTGQRLVAYYLTRDAALPSVDELRDFLKARLPDYMVPAALARLEKFPLSPNGKVDRSALPDLRLESVVMDPSNEMEQNVANIWRDVLQVERVGTGDNFFDLGGSSLHLVQVHTKLQRFLKRDVPMMDLFQFPTIHALATHLKGDLEKPASMDVYQDRARRQKAALAQTRFARR